jgi:hypothetical protein
VPINALLKHILHCCKTARVVVGETTGSYGHLSVGEGHEVMLRIKSAKASAKPAMTNAIKTPAPMHACTRYRYHTHPIDSFASRHSTHLHQFINHGCM